MKVIEQCFSNSTVYCYILPESLKINLRCGLPASPASLGTAASDSLNVLTSSSMSSSSVSCFLTSDLALPSTSSPLSVTVALTLPVKLPLFSLLGDSALI